MRKIRYMKVRDFNSNFEETQVVLAKATWPNARIVLYGMRTELPNPFYVVEEGLPDRCPPRRSFYENFAEAEAEFNYRYKEVVAHNGNTGSVTDV